MDLINREDAAELITRYCKEYYNLNPVAVIEKLMELPSVQPELATDCIRRQAAIDAICSACSIESDYHKCDGYQAGSEWCEEVTALRSLPSAEPTLYGYNIEHLEMIARVLQKENLPPERVVQALTDIGRIVAIVMDEFEESLRKAVEQCTI